MTSADRTAVLVPSNRDLLDRCMAGDQTAWKTLMRRYERVVYAMARKEGLQIETAKDVAQHVFSELFRYVGDISQPERLGSWLMTVTRHEIWRIRRSMIETSELPPDAAFADSEEDFAERYATVEEIHAAVTALGEPCRSLIFELFFNPQAPDYATIAIALGRPVGSIGPMRSRCLDRLRELIEDGPHV